MRPASLFACLLMCATNTFSQAIVSIASKQSSARYYSASAGSITFPVQITVNYNGIAVAAPVTVDFVVAGSSKVALVPNGQTLTGGIIPASDFTTMVKSKTFNVNVTMNAITSLDRSEYFDIQLAGALPSDPVHRVMIEPIAIGETNSTVEIRHLKGNLKTETPFENDNAASKIRSAWLHYSVTGTLAKDSVVDLELISNSGNAINPELETKTFTISKSKTRAGFYSDSVEVYYKVNAVKSFGKDEEVYLKMKNGNIRETITFSRKGMTQQNKPFWIEIGSNFELIEKFKPSNLFTGVFLYKRDVGRISLRGASTRDKANRNFSILGGLYQARTVGSETLGNGEIRYIDNRSLMSDSLGRHSIYIDTGSSSLTTTINNVSLFFSPQVRLSTKSANSDGFHSFIALWTEFLWQRVESVYDYSKMSTMQTELVKRDSLVYFSRRRSSIKQDYRSFYYGLGPSFYMKEEDINLYFHLVAGMTNQTFSVITGRPLTKGEVNGIEYMVHRFNPFFLTTFRLSEEKYGFAFTGELRGLIRDNSKPVLTIALSKKFDLSKLLEFK